MRYILRLATLYYTNWQVSLGKVLKAVLVLKGLMIEWVVIRGWTEESTRVDGQVRQMGKAKSADSSKPTSLSF